MINNSSKNTVRPIKHFASNAKFQESQEKFKSVQSLSTTNLNSQYIDLLVMSNQQNEKTLQPFQQQQKIDLMTRDYSLKKKSGELDNQIISFNTFYQSQDAFLQERQKQGFQQQNQFSDFDLQSVASQKKSSYQLQKIVGSKTYNIDDQQFSVATEFQKKNANSKQNFKLSSVTTSIYSLDDEIGEKSKENSYVRQLSGKQISEKTEVTLQTKEDQTSIPKAFLTGINFRQTQKQSKGRKFLSQDFSDYQLNNRDKFAEKNSHSFTNTHSMTTHIARPEINQQYSLSLKQKYNEDIPTSTLVKMKQLEELQKLKENIRDNIDLHSRISVYDQGNPIKMKNDIQSIIFDPCKLNPKIMDEAIILDNLAQRASSYEQLQFFMNTQPNFSRGSLQNSQIPNNNKIQNILSQRHQLSQLGLWLGETMQELIQSQNSNFQDFFWREQKVFSVALGEIIRQISVQCQQRGELLQKIIDSMIDCNKEIFLFQVGQQQRIEKEYALQIEKIQQENFQNVQKLETQIEELKLQIIENQEKMEIIAQQNYRDRKISRKLVRNANGLQHQINELRGALNQLIKQNITLLGQVLKDPHKQNDAIAYQVTILETSKRKFQLPMEIEHLLQKVAKNEFQKEKRQPGYRNSIVQSHLNAIAKKQLSKDDPNSSQDEIHSKIEDYDKIMISKATWIEPGYIDQTHNAYTDTEQLIGLCDRQTQTQFRPRDSYAQTESLQTYSMDTQTFPFSTVDFQIQVNIYDELNDNQNNIIKSYRSNTQNIGFGVAPISNIKTDKITQVNFDQDQYSLFNNQSATPASNVNASLGFTPVNQKQQPLGYSAGNSMSSVSMNKNISVNGLPDTRPFDIEGEKNQNLYKKIDEVAQQESQNNSPSGNLQTQGLEPGLKRKSDFSKKPVNSQKDQVRSRNNSYAQSINQPKEDNQFNDSHILNKNQPNQTLSQSTDQKLNSSNFNPKGSEQNNSNSNSNINNNITNYDNQTDQINSSGENPFQGDIQNIDSQVNSVNNSSNNIEIDSKAQEKIDEPKKLYRNSINSLDNDGEINQKNNYHSNINQSIGLDDTNDEKFPPSNNTGDYVTRKNSYETKYAISIENIGMISTMNPDEIENLIQKIYNLIKEHLWNCLQTKLESSNRFAIEEVDRLIDNMLLICREQMRRIQEKLNSEIMLKIEMKESQMDLESVIEQKEDEIQKLKEMTENFKNIHQMTKQYVTAESVEQLSEQEEEDKERYRDNYNRQETFKDLGEIDPKPSMLIKSEEFNVNSDGSTPTKKNKNLFKNSNKQKSSQLGTQQSFKIRNREKANSFVSNDYVSGDSNNLNTVKTNPNDLSGSLKPLENQTSTLQQESDEENLKSKNNLNQNSGQNFQSQTFIQLATSPTNNPSKNNANNKKNLESTPKLQNNKNVNQNLLMVGNSQFESDDQDQQLDHNLGYQKTRTFVDIKSIHSHSTKQDQTQSFTNMAGQVIGNLNYKNNYDRRVGSSTDKQLQLLLRQYFKKYFEKQSIFSIFLNVNQNPTQFKSKSNNWDSAFSIVKEIKQTIHPLPQQQQMNINQHHSPPSNNTYQHHENKQTSIILLHPDSNSNNNAHNQNNFNSTQAIKSMENIGLKTNTNKLQQQITNSVNQYENPQNVLKVFNTIFNDLLIIEQNGDILANPLHVYVYDYFIHQFGLKSVAEGQMHKMLEYLGKNSNSTPLINSLALLCGLNVEETISNDSEDLQFYLKCVQKIDSNKVNSQKKIELDKMFFQTSKVQEQVLQLLHYFNEKSRVPEIYKGMEQSLQEEIRKEQFQTQVTGKSTDAKKTPITANTFHHLLNKLLVLYRKTVINLKSQFFDILILTQPSNQERPVSQPEFVMLLKTIENITNQTVLSHFEISFENAANVKGIRSQENQMTIDCFLVFCNTHNLFSKKKQQILQRNRESYTHENVLIAIDQQDIESQLRDEWYDEKLYIKKSLFYCEVYGISVRNLLEQMDDYFKPIASSANLIPGSSINIKEQRSQYSLSRPCMLMAYQMIKQLVDIEMMTYEIQSLIPEEFDDLQISFLSLGQKNNLKEKIQKTPSFQINQTENIII